MQSFKSFSTPTELNEDLLLTEALNNPQEYYMTDDTKMPGSIFAAFDVDGQSYIMSLVESSDKGVYLLEVGKTGSAGGKTYWWKFHNSKHILPVLATTMHFVQASTMWMQGKIKGIAVQFKMGASDQMNRAQRIAERIVKRAYVKSFNVIPVSQPPVTDADKHYYQKVRYLFIAKKGVPLNTVFGGSTFKKYSFDGKQAPIEAMAELKPKKAKKQTNTTKPSTKYSFGQYDVDTPEDPEILKKLQDVKPVDSSGNEQPAYKPVEVAKPFLTYGVPADMIGVVKAISNFSAMINNIQKNGFDESKLNWDNLKYRINQLGENEKAMLDSVNLLNVDLLSTKNNWKTVMAYFDYHANGTDIDMANASDKVKKDVMSYLNAKKTENKPQSTPATGMKSTVNPDELVATMPGSGIVVTFEGGKFKEVDSDSYKKKQFIKQDLGYTTEVFNLKSFSNVVTYSGPGYSGYNGPLRYAIKKLLEGQTVTSKEIKSITANYSKFQKLFSAFNQIKPLPESLWVYRNTYLPDKQAVVPGYQYVDPAFLSTSLRSDLGFGGDQMRIYLPKGSKVIPILDHSKHSGEQEILLPPCSVVKVVEVIKDPSSGKMGIQGVFMGSAFKSITSELKKKLKLSEEYNSMRDILEILAMNEEKEPPYDPAGKFSDVHDQELDELISNAIAKGKLEVDPPKKKD